MSIHNTKHIQLFRSIYRRLLAPFINKYRESELAKKGILVLLVSQLVTFFTCGFSLLLTLFYVYRVANNTSCKINNPGNLIVHGTELHNNAITTNYKKRLERVKELLLLSPHSQIIILGGKTSDSTISEALAGKNYLLTLGCPSSKITTEDLSKNTLKNLEYAKKFLRNNNADQTTLITSRYHLARCHKFAKAMQINHQLCAAEDVLDFSYKTIALLIKEAILLHWYYIGEIWDKLFVKSV